MEVVILAAGRGSRLGPYTDFMPKPMVPVNGKPLIKYSLETLTKVGFERINIVVGYKRDILQEYIKGLKLDATVKYFVQDPLKGIGHAISLVKDNVDDFLLIWGDAFLFEEQLRDLIRLFQRDRPIGCVFVKRRKNWKTCVKIENDVIKEFCFGNFMNEYVPRGAYILQSDIFKYFSEDGDPNLWHFDAFNRAIDAGEKFLPLEIVRYFELNTSEDLKVLEEFLKK